MQDSERRPDHEFEKPISTGPYARPRDEPIGQTEHGLPNDSGKPVEITSEEEAKIAKKSLASETSFANPSPAEIMTTNAWWQTAVIYQVYPRSFQDTNGDGVGDLNGIAQRLGHPVDLGVDAVWISPIFASPMRDFGYDVSDYCNVRPLFGSLGDFDDMLAAAHAVGLKVILDFVPNHTSDHHPSFEESRSSKSNPKRDRYVWRGGKPDGSPPNNWESEFGGSAWTLDAATGQFYYHAYLKDRPDLN